MDQLPFTLSSLQELNVSWMQWSDQFAVDIFDDICAQLPASLRRLNVSGGRTRAMDDANVTQLIDRCGASLVELDISDCNLVTNTGFDDIVTRLPRLRVLTASRTYGIEPIEFT